MTPQYANNYCESTALSNEASVEIFFTNRLITDLGYTDAEIKPKTAIDAVRVPRGHKRELYKPDYLLVCAGQPRWLVEVKATDERIEDFTYQGAGYALQINRRHKARPLRYYMLTNGLFHIRRASTSERPADRRLRTENWSGSNRRGALGRGTCQLAHFARIRQDSLV